MALEDAPEGDGASTAVALRRGRTPLSDMERAQAFLSRFRERMKTEYVGPYGGVRIARLNTLIPRTAHAPQHEGPSVVLSLSAARARDKVQPHAELSRELLRQEIEQLSRPENELAGVLSGQGVERVLLRTKKLNPAKRSTLVSAVDMVRSGTTWSPLPIGALVRADDAVLPEKQSYAPTEDAFRAEMLRSQDALFSYAVSLCRNRTRAHDLVQEALAKALRSRNTYTKHEGRPLQAWLFTILRNHFLSEERTALSRARAHQRLNLKTGSRLTDQTMTLRLNEVMSKMEELPRDFSEALMLIVSGTSYEEAARIQGVEVGTIKSRVHRAREFLKQNTGYYDEEAVDPSAAIDAFDAFEG